MKTWHYLELRTNYITATSLWLSFEPKYIYVLRVGLTSPLELVRFPGFSVAVDKNVNKLLHLKSVTLSVLQIT